MEESKGTRINKYLSEIGYCSRRVADKLVEERRIEINGVVPEMGTRLQPGDKVTVDGEEVGQLEQRHVYLAFNKPVGIVCTTDTVREKDNIIDFINYPTRIFPIGRLDKPSEGLILLTNDGDIVNQVLRARYEHEKEYRVVVSKPLTSTFLKGMGAGVPILDTVTRECEVTQITKFSFTIVLTQGLNRQIRRMCEHFGYKVVKLMRTRIMHLKLDVPVGTYRELTADELAKLKVDTSEHLDASLDAPTAKRPNPAAEAVAVEVPETDQEKKDELAAQFQKEQEAELAHMKELEANLEEEEKRKQAEREAHELEQMQGGMPDTTPEPEREEREDRPQRPERPERPARSERPDRPERSDRPGRSDRPERRAAERAERPERRSRPDNDRRSESRPKSAPKRDYDKPRKSQPEPKIVKMPTFAELTKRAKEEKEKKKKPPTSTED